MKKFQILSPDGIPIENHIGYDSFEEAKNAFDKWLKNYDKQGYYSSNNGRIAFEDIEENCTLIEL